MGDDLATAASVIALLFEQVRDGLCLAAPDGRISRVNSEWARLAGAAARDLLGRDVLELLPEASREALARHARAGAGQVVQVPPHAWPAGEREIWREGSVAPVPMEGGAGLLVTLREVSRAPKGAEEPWRDARGAGAAKALRASEEKFRSVFERAAVGIGRVGLDGRFLEVNERYAEILGCSVDEMLRRDFQAVTHPDDLQRNLELHRGLLAGEYPVYNLAKRYVRKDGTFVWVSLSVALARDEDGRPSYSVAVVEDITPQKRAEEALRASEVRFRLLTEAMPQIVCVLAPDGAVEYVNPAWVAFSGLDLDASRREGWPRVVHPDDLAAARACRERALALLSAQDVELRYRAADGTFRWYLSRLAPIVEDGRVVRFIGVGMDIEERKRAEDRLRVSEERARDVNERLREADRRKDEFLGMLSHELRNPLAPIRNSTYILRHAGPGSEQARRAQDVIERQTEHLTRLVDDLLDVTRIARGKIELRRDRVDLRDVVWRAADDFWLAMQERGIAFQTALPEEQVWTEADGTRITQLVGNLLHNAAKFTRRGDEVTVSLRATHEVAEISVRDTGAGVDPAFLPRIFDAFFQGERTLARTEGGLGLGLALVKGIAELHGGSVRAESAGKEKGAEFIVRLPLTPASVHAAPRPEPERPAAARRLVLVVDDNVDAAETLAEVVRMLGHTVEVAFDGPAAIERARVHPPDVVLCDIGLPLMSGYEVAKVLRSKHASALQLIAISGYAQPEDVKRAVEAGFDAHVAKPCDADELKRLLG